MLRRITSLPKSKKLQFTGCKERANTSESGQETGKLGEFE